MGSDVTILDTSEQDFSLWKSYYTTLAQKGVYHSPEYIKVLEEHYQDEVELFIFGDEENFVYYPYFKRRLDKLPFSDKCDLDLAKYYDIVSSWYYGGPILSGKAQHRHFIKSLVTEFVDCFSEHCHDSNIVSEFIRFDPNIKNHRDFEQILPLRPNRETIFVDLSLSEENIWRGYSGRCRTAIRKGSRSPVKVSIVEPAKFLDVFNEIYHAEMKRKCAPAHYQFSRAFFENLVYALGKKCILFLVSYEGRPVGGTICLFEKGGIAFDYLTATNPDYWKYQINNVLFHEVILWCKRYGALIYDFHGGRDGVAFFKASFSSSRGSFYVSETIHNSTLYDFLVSDMDRYSGEISNTFFPKYRPKDTN